jgi:hypothetical protein
MYAFSARQPIDPALDVAAETSSGHPWLSEVMREVKHPPSFSEGHFLE